MKQEITVQPKLNQTDAIFQMLQTASASKNADPAKLSEMMNIWERAKADQAKTNFIASFAALKPNLPVIIKNNEVTLGGGRGYAYEDMATISKTVDPILAQHGFSYRFHTSSTVDTVTVTCKLSHIDGHTEENSLTAVLDKSNKNPVQALGSSLTYLQRYCLKNSLGLAAAKDTDARPIDDTSETQTDTIKPEQVLVLRALLKKTGRSEERLCKHYNVDRLEDLLVGNYSQAQQVLSRRANGEVTQ